MSNIPQARQRLRDLANELEEEGLCTYSSAIDSIIEEYMMREKPTRKTRPRSKTMTATLAREIRAYARAWPKASHQQIANHFQVNPGRVSEAIARKW